MCNPVAVGIGVVALQSYVSYQSVKAENDAVDFNAGLLERNAETADLQAKDAEARGKADEAQFRSDVETFKGGQRASFGASGVVVDEGSALKTVQDTAALGEADALTIRHNTALEAWGIREDARNLRSQARFSRASKADPKLAAATTLLTSGGSLAASSIKSSKSPSNSAPRPTGPRIR